MKDEKKRIVPCKVNLNEAWCEGCEEENEKPFGERGVERRKVLKIDEIGQNFPADLSLVLLLLSGILSQSLRVCVVAEGKLGGRTGLKWDSN